MESFYLRVQFVTLLNASLSVWARARAIERLSRKNVFQKPLPFLENNYNIKYSGRVKLFYSSFHSS